MDNQELAQHLRDLGNGVIKPRHTSEGICRELQILVNEDRISPRQRIYISILMRGWPKHSGSLTYPVRHSWLISETAYHDTNNLWDNDEYGNNRRELCIWLADELEKLY